jgi:predicted TIM-barrel fold metal-dependent hydrolase
MVQPGGTCVASIGTDTVRTVPASYALTEPPMTPTSRLTDADGHVLEDERAIAERLSGGYRDVWMSRIEHGGPWLGRLFPSVGYLSLMPVKGIGMVDLASQPTISGHDPESWERFLDAVGIETTVLYPTLGLAIGRVRDLGYAIDVTRAYNDWLAETYLQRPSGKFHAAALLPMQVPEAAVAELERCVTTLGFRAAVLPSQGLPNHLGSPQFWPVYEAAAALDVGLACHGGVHDGYGYDDFNAVAPVHAIGHPLGLLISLGGLLFNGVFDRYPTLRMAFLEGGSAWMLLAAERFSESFRAFQPADTSRTLQLEEGRLVKDYLIDLMLSDRLVVGCEGGEDFLGCAIDYFGCAAFMYSSDFPHEVNVESCRHELEELGSLGLADDAVDRIRGGTARTFYRL